MIMKLELRLLGFQSIKIVGQKDKIKEAKRLREEKGYTYKIQIDGSCNKNTFKRLAEAGVEVFIVGSSGLFGLNEDLNKACDQMFMDFEEATK